MDIQLRDANEVSRVAFGVNGNEQFYISNLGNNVQNAAGAVNGSATYLMVLKIVSQDAGQSGNFDQIFLKVFQSGVDAIPDYGRGPGLDAGRLDRTATAVRSSTGSR